MGDRLCDAHCHLGFAPDAARIAREAQAQGIRALCSSVEPEGYARMRMLLADAPGIVAGLGLHPWWVDEGRIAEEDLRLFEELAEDAPFIGEVGLDFSARRKLSRTAQVEAFERAMGCVQRHCPGRPVFLHAVRSTEALLDILDSLDMFDSNACVLHRFSGSVEQLGRAIDRGAWFSCSDRMLAQERGASICALIPADRLLAETDAPSREGAEWSVRQWAQAIEASLHAIAAARGCGEEEARGSIERNYERLSMLMGQQAHG